MGQNIIDDPKGLGRKGGLASAKSKKRMQDFLWSNIGVDPPLKKRAELIEKAMDGEELTKDQKFAIDLISKELEFIAAKRAREDGKGKADIGNTVNINVKDTKTAKLLKDKL